MTDIDLKEQFLNVYKGEYPEGLTDSYELIECIGSGEQEETFLGWR